MSSPHTCVMFLKVSLVVVILLGAAMNCRSVGEELELANIHLQVEQIPSIEDTHQNFTFQLAIGGYDKRFRIRTSLQWENLTLDRVNETIVLNSSVYGPAFDDFCRLLTDGDNMHVEKRILIDKRRDDAFRVGLDDFEQALFANQTGCFNGVDLHDNYIDSIALTIEDFESVYYPTHNLWKTGLNLSLVFSGRPLLPNELDLAIVRPIGRISRYTDNNLTTMYFSAVNGSRWATLEFVIDWNTAVVGDQISVVREFGTHNIRDLITDGDNGYLKISFSNAQVSPANSHSDFFDGQPGCFNGVDLEGHHVQDISLFLEEGSECEVWASGTEACYTVFPKFVFSGSLGDGPAACPDCECEYDCDECDYGLSGHTIAATVEILVLLTAWVWFLV
jgi:hypothetical protein